MVLKGDLANGIPGVYPEIGDRYEFEINTMEVKNNHIHLFSATPRRNSPVEIVRIIKSVSLPPKTAFSPIKLYILLQNINDKSNSF